MTHVVSCLLISRCVVSRNAMMSFTQSAAERKAGGRGGEGEGGGGGKGGGGDGLSHGRSRL